MFHVGSSKHLLVAALAAFVGLAGSTQAAIKTQLVEYKQGDTTLEGYLAYDDAVQGKRPGVLVVHEWDGLGDYAKKRAEMLAQLGYVAFAADIYGKGVRPKGPQESGAEAGKYMKDRNLLRARALAGLDQLKNNSMVDPNKIAAIGYCFGGSTVLELARSGADLAGVVTFHGGLSNPNPEDAKKIKAKVLVLHGADDALVAQTDVEQFQKDMRDAKVDLTFVAYSGTVHAFTNPSVNDPAHGVQYNARSDQRSWQAMRDFFAEIFGK
jgi:dienelactone hydrolase